MDSAGNDGGLGFFFAGALAIADRKLWVEENPLIGMVNEVLHNANCGACGNAGCYDFAVKVVEGKTCNPNLNFHAVSRN